MGVGPPEQECVRVDVKIQLPRPSMCHSQSPPAATEWLQHSYMELLIDLNAISYISPRLNRSCR